MADFIEDVWGWFMVRPERLFNIGCAFLWLGIPLLLVGLWARVAVAAGNGLAHMTKTKVEVDIASMYPGMPTWWIPESFGAFGVVTILITVGISLVVLSKYITRMLGQ